MDKLIVLGTGNAAVTKCYNTCFAITSGKEYFLIDAGGGNGILTQLEKANIDIKDIHHMFVSHKHTDHLLGVIWIIRIVCSLINSNKYVGDLNIYCSKELASIIDTIAKLTIHRDLTKVIGDRVKYVIINDKEKLKVLDYELEFFDTYSPKDEQFGFILNYNNKKLVFLGDEPYNNKMDEAVMNSDWLLTEAFCLYEEKDIFKPYEKFHSTAKDAAEISEKLHVKNIVLWHTEDKNIKNRKELYTKETKEYYNGNIYVPNDLEVIDL